MTQTPLPCPFCGEKKLAFCKDPLGHILMCDNDHCPVNVVSQGDTADEALEHWNRRATFVPLQISPSLAEVLGSERIKRARKRRT